MQLRLLHEPPFQVTEAQQNNKRENEATARTHTIVRANDKQASNQESTSIVKLNASGGGRTSAPEQHIQSFGSHRSTITIKFNVRNNTRSCCQCLCV